MCVCSTHTLFFFSIILRFCGLVALRNLHHHTAEVPAESPLLLLLASTSTSTGLCSPRDLHPGFVFLSSFAGALPLPMKVISSESLSKFILLCIIQRIINRAEAICLATAKMASESKYKDDISGVVLYILTSFPHISASVLPPSMGEELQCICFPWSAG